MSDRPSLTVVAEPTDPETDKLVTSGFGLNNSLTSYNYQLFTIQLERDNDESLGIHLTDSLVVCSVNRENVDVLFGDLWLELDGVPLKNKRHFAKLYFKMTDKPKSRVILKLKIARLICRFKLQDDEIKKLPVDVTATNRHFKYHKALVYGIPGMRLTLGLKSVNDKVYVVTTTDETLGKMSFDVGDSIVNVDNKIVTTISEAHERLKVALKSNRIAICIVERPKSDDGKYLVREALMNDKNPEREERLNKDIEKICNREIRRMSKTNDVSLKSIMRTKDSPVVLRRIQLNGKITECTINADMNPKLLKAVPTKNLLPLDTPMAPGKSAEEIIRELAAERVAICSRSVESGNTSSVASKSLTSIDSSGKKSNKQTNTTTTGPSTNQQVTKVVSSSPLMKKSEPSSTLLSPTKTKTTTSMSTEIPHRKASSAEVTSNNRKLISKKANERTRGSTEPRKRHEKDVSVDHIPKARRATR